jgi:hypothetical protein
VSFLDRTVEALAKLLDSLGMNGTRLRWRWNQRQRLLGEQGMRAELMWRSAKAPHKMCPPAGPRRRGVHGVRRSRG